MRIAQIITVCFLCSSMRNFMFSNVSFKNGRLRILLRMVKAPAARLTLPKKPKCPALAASRYIQPARQQGGALLLWGYVMPCPRQRLRARRHPDNRLQILRSCLHRPSLPASGQWAYGPARAGRTWRRSRSHGFRQRS